MLKIHMELEGYSEIPPCRWTTKKVKDFTMDDNEFTLEIINNFGIEALNNINNTSDKTFTLFVHKLNKENHYDEITFNCELLS